MIKQSVGSEIFVDSAKRRVGFRRPPRAGNSTRGIDNEGVEFYKLIHDERGNGEGCTRWITTGHGNSGCRRDLRSIELGQSVGKFVEKLRTWMDLAVPLRIKRCVLQPEVRSEIHDPLDPRHQRRHERLRCTMRQPTKDEIDAIKQRFVKGRKLQSAIGGCQTWIQLRDRNTRLAIAGRKREIKLRVCGDESK
jgi:hypothetical protein